MKILLSLLVVLCFSTLVQAQTTEEWYLCPYDAIYDADTDRITRKCALTRYIPALPDGNGSDWDEAEILSGWCVVWVEALPAIHTTIQADVDFWVIPFPIIPPQDRPAVRAHLRSLGYTNTEINATGWEPYVLMELLTVGSTAYRRKPGTDELEEDPDKPGRQPPHKRADQIKGWP